MKFLHKFSLEDSHLLASRSLWHWLAYLVPLEEADPFGKARGDSDSD